MKNHIEQTKWSQFLSLIIVFFFWGFVAASNEILIPVFKKWFVLTQVQSQLVAWAFYAAYFIGSLIFFLISLKKDILQIFGYKKTLALGLIISSIGAFLFYPAASTADFWLFLCALFIVGLGFSIQQIVANPLAIRMGDPSTGTHRLTLAGGINSLGTTIGPILVGLALFGPAKEQKQIPENATKLEVVNNEFYDLKNSLIQNLQELELENSLPKNEKIILIDQVNNYAEHIQNIQNEIEQSTDNNDSYALQLTNELDTIRKEISQIQYPKSIVKKHLEMVKIPYLILGIAFILVAIFLLFSKIQDPEKDNQSTELKSTEKFSIKKYPQLLLGMLALFLYVGAEVSIISNLPALLHTRDFGSILEHDIAPFISLYWGSLMIGRWNGSINVFKISNIANIALKWIVPFIAFGVIIIANTLSGKNVSSFYIYALWIVIFIIMSYLGGKSPSRTLMVFGLSGAVMMLIGLFYPDKTIATYFFISGGLFCSIMWPAIFDLAINGLGNHTGKASSFLIMMILGGGIIPLIQGWICDFDTVLNGQKILGLTYTHFSYIVPTICFLYIAFYGLIAPKVTKSSE